MNKYIKRIISGTLVFSIFASTLITSQAATDVNVSVNVNPKIDIMLTSKDTTLNLDNFESDIKTSLQNKGININNIQFKTVDRRESSIASTDLDVDKIINSWETVGAPTWSSENGQIYSKVPGGNNGRPTETFPWNDTYTTAWWGTGLINPNAYTTDNIEINFTMIDGGNLMEGPCFFVTKNNDGSLNGYFINIANHVKYGKTYYECHLWRFDHYTLDQSFSSGINYLLWCLVEPNIDHNKNGSVNGESTWKVGETTVYNNDSFTCLAEWFDYEKTNTNYRIIANNGNIKIYKNNELVVNLNDNTYTSGTYGFWGNNCEQTASMHLSDINIKTEETFYKTYKEVLTEPTWRNDAEHIVVNVDNNIDDTLTSSSTIGEILSRTLADDIHFIQWGTATNKSASETFITRNDNKGLFINNSNYDQAVEETANYIVSLIDQESSEQYITIGQDISFSVDPAEYKTGATSTEYPNGRWKINHEYKYFANNQGQSSESGVPTADLNFNFDKPGKYNILFDDKLVKEVYVHRKPVADFEIEITGNELKLMSTSYDLDSNENKGIAKENWYYKEASASEWIEGKLTEFDKTKIYVIKLEVEDYQGVTSYTTKYTGTGNPVSNFNYANDVVSKYKPLVINNTSYDPEGYEIVEQNWVLKKDGVVVSESSEPVTNFNVDGLGEGNYTYTLTVKNNLGTVSEAFTKSFTIEEDYGKPEVAIGQQGCDWKHSQAVSLEFSDNESEFKNWRYAFTTSPVAPATDEEWSDWSEETDTTIQISDVSGKYYLHIEAYDIANNSLTRAVGTYNLDNTDPIINDVKTQKDEINKTFIKVEATDEHSGVVGYAITKAEPMTFNLRTRSTNLEIPTEFQESNILEVTDNGTYNV